MSEKDFEGTLVLEKLAAIDKVDEFFDVIDSDDFEGARELMNQAGVDPETVDIVLKKMAEGNAEH